MCDQITQGIIEKIVAEFVAGKKIFTSLNVSRKAQKDHGITLRHNEMKNEAHRIYADGNMIDPSGQSYNRKLIDIPNVNGQAYAYYPDGVDPDNYDLSAIVSGPIDTNDAGTVPVPQLSASQGVGTGTTPFNPFGSLSSVGAALAAKTTSTATGKYAVDKRKRLWIPKDMVKAVGGKRGMSLDVTVDGKSLVVTAKGANTKTPFTSYQVDSKGNIAISQNVFAAAGLTATTYDILEMNGQVLVKQA